MKRLIKRAFPNPLNAVLFVVAVFVLVVVLFPVVAPVVYANHMAYRQVLSFHTVENAPRWHKQKPFLYLSWFPKGNPKHAEEALAYADGMLMGRRVLWNYAIQGGGRPCQDAEALQSLRRLPALPPGVSGPYAIPYEREIIISQSVSGQWRTFYYDRNHLPVQVQSALRLYEAASGQRV